MNSNNEARALEIITRGGKTFDYLVVDVEKELNIEKKFFNDSKEDTSISHKGKDKEPVLNEEVDYEEGDPKVVENNEVRTDPMPTMMANILFPQRLTKGG